MRKILLTFSLVTIVLLTNAQTPGNALRYDGTNQVEGNLPSYLGTVGSKSFTVEMWVKNEIADAQINERQILCIAQSDENNYFHLIQDNGQLSAYVKKNGKLIQSFGYTGDKRSQWIHVCCTFNASTNQLNIFMDGLYLDGTGTTVKTNYDYSYINRMFIGAYGFTGILDEVHIWNFDLSVCQIRAGMNADYTLPTPTGLMTVYNFNQGVAAGNNTTITTLTDLRLSSHATLGYFTLSGWYSNWVPSNAPITARNVDPAENTNDVVRIGDTLKVVLSGASYSWNGSVSTNITTQWIVPVVSGTYVAGISKNGCVQHSDPIDYVVVTTDVKTNTLDKIKLFANPVSNEITIESGQQKGNISVEVINISGIIVDKFFMSNEGTYSFNLNQPKGMYIIKVNAENNTQTFKVVKY